MEHYVGLDVSLKLTSICIVDRTGKVEREGVVTSDPEAIATFIKLHASHVVRIGLGLPVICLPTRASDSAPDICGLGRVTVMPASWQARISGLLK
jgi:predicted NBD/HSP70 family sugar kinase